MFDPLDAFQHTMAVPVRGIDHDGVHPSFDQGFYTLFSALAYTDRSAHTQTTSSVTRCIGETGLLGNVFNGNEPFEFKRIIDHQQALEFVFVQQSFGLFGCRAFRHRHQTLARRHDLFDLHVITALKAQIAVCHDADHFATIAHWKT